MFHYENNEQRTAQFGLIAKKIATLSSALVALDDNAKIYRVRYDTVNAMLLNEFLKEHGRVEKVEATIARQQKQIEWSHCGFAENERPSRGGPPTSQVVVNESVICRMSSEFSTSAVESGRRKTAKESTRL